MKITYNPLIAPGFYLPLLLLLLLLLGRVLTVNTMTMITHIRLDSPFNCGKLPNITAFTTGYYEVARGL